MSRVCPVSPPVTAWADFPLDNKCFNDIILDCEVPFLWPHHFPHQWDEITTISNKCPIIKTQSAPPGKCWCWYCCFHSSPLMWAPLFAKRGFAERFPLLKGQCWRFTACVYHQAELLAEPRWSRPGQWVRAPVPRADPPGTKVRGTHAGKAPDPLIGTRRFQSHPRSAFLVNPSVKFSPVGWFIPHTHTKLSLSITWQDQPIAAWRLSRWR